MTQLIKKVYSDAPPALRSYLPQGAECVCARIQALPEPQFINEILEDDEEQKLVLMEELTNYLLD